MISSFQNVYQELLKQFGDGNIVSTIQMTDYRGNNFNVIFRSAFKSADNTIEETRDQYPMMLITPFAPRYREGFRPDEKPFYTDPRDTDNDDKLDSIYEAFEPLAMVFRYELNIYAKNDRHLFAMQEWLTRQFEYRAQEFFDFNVTETQPTVWGEQTNGDKVEFRFRHIADPVRSDGVRESLYELLLFPYVYIKDPVDLPLIQDLNIGYTGSIENF